jgi:hypothetical protein
MRGGLFVALTRAFTTRHTTRSDALTSRGRLIFGVKNSHQPGRPVGILFALILSAGAAALALAPAAGASVAVSTHAILAGDGSAANFDSPGSLLATQAPAHAERAGSHGKSLVAGPHVTPTQSSEGTDFWVTFESNCTTDGCGSPSGPGNLFLFISGSTATTGTVSDPGISFSQTFSVTPGTVTSIQLPSTAEDDVTDTVAPDGIHITAAAPVSAYGLNTLEYTTDGYLGLPTDILGTSYLVEGYGGGTGSQFAVVGTQDGTTVTITPSENVDSYTAGTPYTVSLDQGQVYQLVDESGGDLSGTSITSNNPVAVFAGNDCADVPAGYAACNTLAEEMTPTDAWGTSFVTEPLATRNGDTFRFMASEDDTTVDVDGTAVATLNTGQFYETILTSASLITANNPIEVMQYSNGEEYDDANADPFDITIPPSAQFLNSYTVTTEPDGADPAITNNYINVTAPTSEVGSVSLDGTDIPSADFTAIPGSSFSGAQVAVAFGSHVLSATDPFGVTVYGYGGADGYGYPGGFTLSPIASVTNIALSGSGTGPVGTQACFTATVTDQDDNPLNGINVEFTDTGANPSSGFAYTGTNGEAQYCYTGTAVGTDSIVASVQTVQSAAASWVWTSASTAAPTTVSTSLSGGGQGGGTISVPLGTSVTDSATLSGANASTAGGTVTYNVYSDAACTKLVGPAGGGTVSAGALPSSSPEALSTPGTYYWQASYSGDSANAASSSACGSEVETVSSKPVVVIPPVIAGKAGVGVTLICAPGAWMNDPTAYTYQWNRDGSPLAGATGPTYVVTALDEGSFLTCTVTAKNAGGTGQSTSAAIAVPIPAVPGCPRATGTLSGRTIGLIHLGMTREQARLAYRRHSNRGRRYEDFFCLTPIGIRVGYASPKLLRHLSSQEQAKVQGTVVWSSTSNPYYALDGIRAGDSITAARARLHTTAEFHVGRNTWYLARKRTLTAVLKVRNGKVQEVGIAVNALTATHQLESILMHSFY